MSSNGIHQNETYLPTELEDRFVAEEGPRAPEISVVIPLFNEAESIETLYTELTAVLAQLPRTYEVIVVDDGSTDDSFQRLKAKHELDPHWRIIRFRRNFGQTAGLAAGFEAARASIIITIDADLQNDPGDIPRLLEKMDEGYDIVSGWRRDRKEPFFSRRLPSATANLLISRLTAVHLHDYGCTLKAYRKEVVENIRLYGELHRFIPAIASSTGIVVAEIPVNDRARRFGKSKYNLTRTFKVILDLISVVFFLIYSTRPLHIFGAVGFIMASIGGLLGVYLAYLRLVLQQSIGDRPLLLLVVLLIVLGVQTIGIGLVAEIVVRNSYEPREKKIFVIREQLGAPEKRP